VWGVEKKQGEVREWVGVLEGELGPVRKTPGINSVMGKARRGAGNAMLKKKDYSGAKRMASKLKRLGRKVRSKNIEASGDALSAAIKKARSR